MNRPTHAWIAALTLTAAVAVGVLLVAADRRRDPWPGPVRPASAVGDSTCLSCHGDKAAYETTAHRLTMQHPSRTSIHGSFAPGENVLRSSDPNVYFQMHADSTGFYQTGVIRTGADTSVRTERIAIVAGSGRKGQSFLYRSGGRLYQLPASYWEGLHRWIGSPGPMKVDPRAGFDRQVAPRCLECHATWIDWVPDLAVVNRYQADDAILGITCERCHGAGRTHVARERSVLRTVRRPAIVNPATLSRERQMETCAQCHAGPGNPVLPPFTYVAGRPLSRYLEIALRAPAEVVDVHDNQVALLMRSKCYQASQMTCLTCHDVHRTQRNVVDLSARCVTCHQPDRTPHPSQQGVALTGRCVDCHMPLQSSNLIVSDLEGHQQRAQGRSHWIRVYR